jgi:hypothetical protein
MGLALLPVPKKNGVVRIATFLKRANSHGLDNLKKQLLSGTLFFVREVSQKHR